MLKRFSSFSYLMDTTRVFWAWLLIPNTRSTWASQSSLRKKAVYSWNAGSKQARSGTLSNKKDIRARDRCREVVRLVLEGKRYPYIQIYFS